MISKLVNRLLTASASDSVYALLLAAAAIGVFVTLTGHNPLQVMSLFVCGSVGDLEALYGSLISSVPLIFSGLSLAIAFRAGLFNIGCEGQIYIGGFCAAIVGHYINAGPFTVLLMALSGIAAGVLWSLLPIIIKLYRGAHEVVGGIMMNYIAINLCLWLVRGPFAAGGATERTPPVVDGGMWPRIDSIGATELNSVFLVAVVTAVLLAWWLFGHPFGFELRAMGAGEGAARSSGIRVKKTLLLSFAIAGAIAGFGGAAGVSGIHGAFLGQFSPGYGFDGITVALLARNHPVGVIATALLFGSMRNASKLLQWHADIGPEIVFLFQGLVILSLIAARPLRNFLFGRTRRQ